MTPHDIARRHLDAGISLIPIATNGTKSPDARLLPRLHDPDTGRWRSTWKPYQDRLATPEEAQRWWGGPQPPGLAAVCGAISCGLELLDFDRDAESTFAAWLSLVREEAPTLPERACALVRTPAGRHCWYCCPDRETPGNRILASEAGPGKGRLIETRGEGGYALVPGCPPACHPDGGSYVLEGGRPIWELPAWPCSLDEAELLVRCAQVLDRAPPREDPLPAGPAAGELAPGSDFDLRGPDWPALLEPHGWRTVGGVGGGEIRWKRPGKDAPGWSATTGRCRGADGADLLRIFSTNAQPFEEGKAYGRFRALALLEFAGDLSRCASELARRGYGTPRPSAALRAARGLPPRPTTQEMERVVMVLLEYPGEVADALRPILRKLGVLEGGGNRHG